MKIKALAAILALTACTGGANSADKNGVGMPPSKVDAAGAVKPMFSGCYVGGSGGGVIVADSFSAASVATLGVEAGCDLQQSVIVFGVRAGYDFAESNSRFAMVGARAGYLINPHALLYGTLTLTMDGRSPMLDDSILSAGIGAELYAFTARTTIFIEAGKDIKAFGEVSGLSEAWTVRAGARYRF